MCERVRGSRRGANPLGNSVSLSVHTQWSVSEYGTNSLEYGSLWTAFAPVVYRAFDRCYLVLGLAVCVESLSPGNSAKHQCIMEYEWNQQTGV